MDVKTGREIGTKIAGILIFLILISSVSAINLNTDSIYLENQSLKGELIINFDATDTVPESALITFSTDTKQYEFPLNNISSKEVEYIPVYFSLKIVEKEIEETQETENSIEDNETIYEENSTEGVNNSEQNQGQNSEANQTAPITGGVIGGFFKAIFNFFQRLIMTGRVTFGEEEIQGQVKFGEQIIYNLSRGQSFEIVDGDINLEMKGNRAIITTNYSEEKTQTFKINLENLNILIEENEIIISITDKGTELIYKKISLEEDFEDVKLILNEDEIQVLKGKFENETMKIVEERQVEDRLIIKYSLGEYWFEPSYSLNADEQEKENDKIRWLKDLAKTISEEEQN